MRSIIAALIVLIMFGLNAAAQEEKAADLSDWDFFGLTFFPDVPSSAKYSNVFGFKCGAPISFGRGMVGGVEFAAFCCMTYNVNGVQTAPLFCMGKEINGLQASPVNIAQEVDGLQFGLVNVSSKRSVQLGLVNYIKDAWCPWTIIFNCKF